MKQHKWNELFIEYRACASVYNDIIKNEKHIWNPAKHEEESQIERLFGMNKVLIILKDIDARFIRNEDNTIKEIEFYDLITNQILKKIKI